jgi:hypothetical protein
MRKTAIVTGASRGIGRTIALRLAADGFGVVVNYAGNLAKAEEVVNEITSSGGRGLAVQADVANPEDVKQLFEKTLKAFGQIDVVVNNAGIMPLSPIAKGDVETFDKVIATNLRGTFLVLSQAAQHVAEGGRIIAFSSSVLAKTFLPTALTSPPRQASKALSMSSPTSFADMRARSNSNVDSKAPSKGRPRSKPSSKKWFGMLANRPHRLRNFLFYKEKNSEDTTNDEVHSWRRDRCGSHLLLRFGERTSEGEEDE